MQAVNGTSFLDLPTELLSMLMKDYLAYKDTYSLSFCGSKWLKAIADDVLETRGKVCGILLLCISKLYYKINFNIVNIVVMNAFCGHK